MISSHDEKSALALKKPKILVLSIDFDGCIFHSGYRKSTAQNRLIETNEMFIQHVLNEIKEGAYDKVIFMVGSNRQSKSIDDLNSGSKGSCYPALLRLCEEIQNRTNIPCDVDRYLLSDTYGNRPVGENFTKAVNEENYSFSSFIWDEHKYTLAYAQMHKIAAENPDADIFYHFYDDRDDILYCQSGFYDDKKELVANNLKYCPFLYNGKELRKYEREDFHTHEHKGEVKGVGIADSFFQENIKRIARCCGFDTDYPRTGTSGDTGISERFYGKLIKQFQNERLLKIKDSCFELAYEIKCIEQDARYPKIDREPFSNALRNLYQEIMQEIKNKNKDKAPAKEETSKHSAIKIASDTISMLREFRESNIQYNEYFNNDRKNEMTKYIDTYGQPINYFKSSIKTFTNTVSNMFHKRSLINQCVYQLAESLKPMLIADEFEFKSFESAKTVRYAYH